MNVRNRPARALAVAIALVAALTLGACSSSSGSSTATSTGGAPAGSSPVLPVTDNPITNSSTDQTLTIDSVLAENNEDADGNAVDDHLEIALTNTGTDPLTGFEVFYTFTDTTTDASESYYAALPDTFTIEPGSSRVAHFDNTGATDHFPTTDFSLYKTSTNAQEVTVEVSARGAAVQTATVQKDAGGAEEAD